MRMTTEGKMEVIKAFSEGKPVEIYTIHGWWETKVNDVWDFQKCIYRIKPEETAPKFKVGDKIVLIRDEGKASPIINTLTEMCNDRVRLNSCSELSLRELCERYTSVENVLWYFETYDCTTKKWGLITAWRFTIKEADKEFASSHHITKWRPMYALGFALKEK
ncbi:hypothetical protein [Campylobacter concisus]|uniref:hypothetical protein n=1 Tax=Campylobacter concisus TaxID=199 RepID=UPI000D3C38A6|nr:hypothetical protein [Campylobacter concisus]QPH88712.1 hypothetical protein CVT15_08370 [Campylobacter concisus]